MRCPSILAMLAVLLCAPGAGFAQASGEAPPPKAPDTVETDEDDTASQSSGEVRANPFVSGKLATTERDRDFGHRSAQLADQFRAGNGGLAPVDRRQEISSMSDRNVLAPMAQTVPQGTTTYSNYNLLGNLLTYGVSDKLAVTGGVVIPAGGGDFITTVSGKYKLHESRNWIVSMHPFGAISNGTLNLDTYQVGLGSGLLADYHLSDTVVLAGGVYGFATLAAGYDQYSANCNRSDFQSERCEVETTQLVLPAGGHWVAATLGANWYVTEAFAINLEYILGGSWGTFLGVEDISPRNDIDSRRARFEDPEFASGFPHGQGPTISIGGSWSNGTTALQFATVFLRRQDNENTFVVDESQEFTPMPMLSAAFHF